MTKKAAVGYYGDAIEMQSMIVMSDNSREA
jgi:hypothetical protein